MSAVFNCTKCFLSPTHYVAHIFFVIKYLAIGAEELWDVGQERGQCVIDSDCEVVQVHEKDYQDLVSAHAIDGCGDPLLNLVLSHRIHSYLFYSQHSKYDDHR